MAPSPRSRLLARFHKIPYVNIGTGILTDSFRHGKAGTVALLADPTLSPDVMGA
jgi:hypothetical protein